MKLGYDDFLELTKKCILFEEKYCNQLISGSMFSRIGCKFRKHYTVTDLQQAWPSDKINQRYAI